ncbi:MAG: alpha/beta fold hydrolase [Pseudomonadota bacterium]
MSRAAGAQGAAPWLGDEGPAPGETVWLRAEDGTRIRAALWPAEGGARGHVLLFPGRTEYLEKYVRVVARLRARGFAVAAADWRGQGLSDREAGRLGHVGDFAEFQRDVAALTGWEAVAGLPGPRVLLAHSMGGCIGLRALAEGTVAPQAAVFSAPMWGLPMDGFSGAATRLAARAMVALGWGRTPLPGRSSERTYVMEGSFEGNVLTTDPGHWDWFREQAAAHPELTLGAPTWGWLLAALREMAALATAKVPPVPRLILLGGEESVVSPAAIRAHADRFGVAELAELPGGRHETLMEPDDRDPGKAAWAAIDAFLEARGV